MQQCKKIQRILHTQSPKEREQEEQNLLEEHLSQCASCREYQKMMHLTSEVIQTWDIPKVSQAFSVRVLEATEDIPQSIPWYNLWAQSRWFPATAAAAVTLAFSLMIGALSLPTQQSTSAKTLQQSFELIHGPALKTDEASLAANMLGLEVN